MEDTNVKRISRFMAILLVLAVTLTSAVFAESSDSLAQRYQDAISQLERYLLNLQDDPVSIRSVAEEFQKLGNYEGSSAFYYYTLGLADAAENNFVLIPMYIDALKINTGFNDRLMELRRNGSNLPTVSEWAAYLNGRVAENEGNYAEAAAQYQQCLNVLDAQTRILYALALGKQTTAAPIATPTPQPVATAAPTAEPTAEPVKEEPPKLYISTSSDSISLEWTYVGNSAKYYLYRRRNNIDNEYQLIYSGTSTSYMDTSIQANNTYIYYVAATTASGQHLTSAVKSAIIRSDDSNNQTEEPPKLYVNTNSNSISLEWTATNNATNYTLYRRRSNSNVSYSVLYSGRSLSYTDTSAEPNCTYSYYVVATTSSAKNYTSNSKTASIRGTTTSNQKVNPPTLYANANSKSITLEWTSVSGATNYALYRRRTSYDSNYQLVYGGSSLSYTDTSASANYKYTYYVVATTSSGQQLTSNTKEAIIHGNNSGSNVTQKPVTPKPVTPKPVTPAPVTPAPVTPPPTAPKQQWSAWTQWSTTPVSSSATRQVETKVETEYTTTKSYTYSRWYYYNTGWEKWTHSYTDYTGSNYKPGSGSWQYKTTTEPLSKVNTIDGRQQYSGGWWNETVSNKQEAHQVTYYRYRDLQ